MYKQNASAEKTATKQQTKPQATVESLAETAELAGESLSFDGLASSQVKWLGNQQFSAIQRQMWASQVGLTQGNRHLNKALKATERFPQPKESSFVATQYQPARYRSPALQMRSQLRTPVFSRLVVQRAVSTSGGEWDTDQYDLVQDVDGLGNPTPAAAGVRGVDIKIKFTPGNSVDAELIGLTQSVQAFVNNAPNLTPAAATRAIPSTDAININTGTGETDEGTAIDRASSYNNPIYPVQSSPSASLDDPNTSAGWGQNGFHYKDKSGNAKNANATLIDKPRRPNAAKDSRHIFETTALATKGVQTGTYYGSVRWGWRTDNKGNFTKLPLSKVSDGVPSSTFMKAAEIWNPGKSSTNAENVDLPLVDVFVTTIATDMRETRTRTILQLPANTRVRIKNWTSLMSNYLEIEIVDGPHTGKTGYLHNDILRDERTQSRPPLGPGIPELTSGTGSVVV